MSKEDVSKLEFSAAIDNLKAFAGVDPNSLQTLRDLSKVGSPVGRSLRIVTLALGDEKDHQGTPVTNLEGDICYLNRSNDQTSYLVVTTAATGLIQRWNSAIPKNRTDPRYLDGHRIFFPTDLGMENPTYLLRAGVGQVLNKYDLRTDLRPEAVQGYATILQKFLKDLIPTFIPPSGS